MLRALLLASILVSNVAANRVEAQETFGEFRTKLIAEFLPDGRKIRLTHPFSFRDPSGKLWSVPTGAVVDGASIPQAFWSLIGGPLDGQYREASVVHDHYCEEQSERWESVHLMFYQAMRANGVEPIRAKLMYAAVYNFGPRWIAVTPERNEPLITGRPVLVAQAKDAIVKFIMDNDPTIKEVQELSDRLARVENVEQLEQLLSANTNCTPIILGGRSPDKTLVLCGLTKAAKQQAAVKNLATLISDLGGLVRTQQLIFLPAVEEYSRSPSADTWNKVIEHARTVMGLVKVGLKSVLDLQGALDPKATSHVDNIYDLLAQRSVMISRILIGPPESRDELIRWQTEYNRLITRLTLELLDLQKILTSVR